MLYPLGHVAQIHVDILKKGIEATKLEYYTGLDTVCFLLFPDLGRSL